MNATLLTGLYAEKDSARKIFYEEYKDRVFSYCLRILRNETLAIDATAESFLRVFKKIGSFKGKSEDFDKWFFRIVHNISIDIMRKEKKYVDFIDKGYYKKDITIEKIHLEMALGKIKEEYRSVLILFYKEGFGIKEISEIVDIPENTIKTWLRRGKEELRKYL